MNDIISLDDYRNLEDVIKNRLGAKQVVVCATLESGDFLTFIPSDLMDIDLVYMIQNLKDRRNERLQ